MGVFTVADALRVAAIDAGHELDLFEPLPLTLAKLAEHAGVRATHRFVALVDALVALGALVRDGDTIARGSVPPRSAEPMIGGWGAIAEVIRTDTPLSLGDADIAHRYQKHLVVAGAPAAREVAGMVARARRALDIGGGAGAYTRALLESDPELRVTLVDLPDVIELARAELADVAARIEFAAGDARDVCAHDVLRGGDTNDVRRGGDTNDVLRAGDMLDGGRAFDLAIVANVLHLHGSASCADLCASVSRAVGAGGVVAIVDLRRGTIEGEMFALNMALYTEGGSVYSVDQISAWLRAAGLAEIEERRLESAPEMMVVLARRPSAS